MRCLIVFASLAASTIAFGQWTVTQYDDGSGGISLTAGYAEQVGGSRFGPAYWPNGNSSLVQFYNDLGHGGSIYAMNAGTQVGFVNDYPHGVGDHAYLFQGTVSSAVDLNPAGHPTSYIYCMGNSLLAGMAVSSTYQNHGAIWTGGAHSYLDLNSGTGASQVYSATDLEQAGFFTPSGDQHACIWHGTAGSAIDLHPVGATLSLAIFTDGTRQAGIANFSGHIDAGYWTGTATSWTDVTPNVYNLRDLVASDGTHFFGRVVISSSVSFGALWTAGDTGYLNIDQALAPYNAASIWQGNRPGDGALWNYNGRLHLTFTATPTANNTYREGFLISGVPSQLTGTVTLGNFAGDPSTQLVTIEVRNHGSTVPLDSYTAALDSGGHYSVTSVRTGTFDVAIKGSHWLRRVIPNVVFSSSGEAADAALINGDVNGDNTVSLADFAALRSAYGSSSGNTNWNPNADLNGDGSVGLGDFAILRSHYGQSGDN